MLTRLATQLCAVQALSGKTIVLDNVRDSEVGVIQIDEDGDITTSAQRPFVNVFSEDSDSESGRLELMGSNDFMQVFQFGVTSAMPLVTSDGNYLLDEETGAIVFAEREKPSDAQINILVEIIERQIRVALTDPNNDWAQLWGRFLMGPYEFKSSRGQSRSDSIRFGARQLSVSGTLIAEPAYGAAVQEGSPWQRFLELLTGSALEHLRDDFERLLGTGDPQDDLAFFQRRYGHSSGAAKALGYGFDADRDPDQPITETVVTDVDGRSS